MEGRDGRLQKTSNCPFPPLSGTLSTERDRALLQDQTERARGLWWPLSFPLSLLKAQSSNLRDKEPAAKLLNDPREEISVGRWNSCLWGENEKAQCGIKKIARLPPGEWDRGKETPGAPAAFLLGVHEVTFCIQNYLRLSHTLWLMGSLTFLAPKTSDQSGKHQLRGALCWSLGIKYPQQVQG